MFDKTASTTNVAKFSLESGTLLVNELGNYDLTKEASFESGLDTSDLSYSSPQLGDTGAFVIDGIATDPFEITSIRKTASGWESIKGDFGLLKSAELVSTFAETSEFLKEGSTIIVPSNAKFIKLAKHDTTIAEIQNIVKNEHERNLFKKASISHKVGKDSANLYYLEGPEFSKYAAYAPTRNLNINEAKWAALHCGATENDLNKIAELSVTQTVTLEGKMKSPAHLDEFKEKVAERHNSLSEESLASKTVLVKSAASFKDKTTVEAVLSLGLARKRNLAQYLNMLPNFEFVLTDIAKALLAARLGVNGISPDTAKEALDAMSALVEELQTVASSEKS